MAKWLKRNGLAVATRGRPGLSSFGLPVGLAVLLLLAACGGRGTEVLLPS